ncbi:MULTISPECIES: DUF2235 domain-containing protein [Thalassotalea]|uniref:DUF2235 domain-containing protein n=1 Tax=Thalassotalea castellviae TaxID=3075612 RepID=A0ABU3A2W4_9GAMM|nr:DUF2235 domain-containing protein [Thalassotalea sp. W431]MDT0604510.1 DUF2235 domain-containing protein [Thalassotalea sp. W431]
MKNSSKPFLLIGIEFGKYGLFNGHFFSFVYTVFSEFFRKVTMRGIVYSRATSKDVKMKRIIICADGTWNRPEQLGKDQYPTSVLTFARHLLPEDDTGTKQVVFYDWGIGSYHDQLSGGAFGAGLEKNVLDGYRFLVHNYDIGDEIYLFGFSRGAYTIRSLCGLINNCSVLKSAEGRLVEKAFDIYKTKKHTPKSQFAKDWRAEHSIANQVKIHFVGVWDTVGALGLPFSIFGLIKDKHLFYDRKLGSNLKTVRHALSLDETRDDFEATIWQPRDDVDLAQVWFAGVHADIGGSYKPDNDGKVLSDIPMQWLLTEAENSGLAFDNQLKQRALRAHNCANASQHNEYKGKYKLLGKRIREIPAQTEIPTYVHSSVQTRYLSSYKSQPIENYIKKHGQWPPIW